MANSKDIFDEVIFIKKKLQENHLEAIDRLARIEEHQISTNGRVSRLEKSERWMIGTGITFLITVIGILLAA